MESIFKIKVNDITEYTISTYLDKEEIEWRGLSIRYFRKQALGKWTLGR